jgi:hypothetical protein
MEIIAIHWHKRIIKRAQSRDLSKGKNDLLNYRTLCQRAQSRDLSKGKNPLLNLKHLKEQIKKNK